MFIRISINANIVAAVAIINIDGGGDNVEEDEPLDDLTLLLEFLLLLIVTLLLLLELSFVRLGPMRKVLNKKLMEI